MPLKIAYIFPGQGSQRVGMGRDLCEAYPAARAVFEAADDTLGFPLSRLCFEGPEEELRQTINAQAALLATSLAGWQALVEANGRNSLPEASFVAGHSLGEYTALAVSGVFDPATAIYLARERGRLMYEAGLKEPGGMAAVIGLDEEKLNKVCAETGAVIANINCPGQLVISGARENLATAIDLARERGALRVIPLAVSGAFHSPLMQPAVSGMRQILDSLNLAPAATPVIANTTAQPVSAPAPIKAELLAQLCQCVQWQGSVQHMLKHGVTAFVEIGPGKVLSGLIRRISKEVKTLNVSDVPSLEATGRALPELLTGK